MSDFFFSETRKRSRRVKDDIYVFLMRTRMILTYIFSQKRSVESTKVSKFICITMRFHFIISIYSYKKFLSSCSRAFFFFFIF